MAASMADVEHSQHRSGLPGRCQHCANTALQRGNLLLYRIKRRVAQTGVKETASSKSNSRPIASEVSYRKVVLCTIGITRGSRCRDDIPRECTVYPYDTRSFLTLPCVQIKSACPKWDKQFSTYHIMFFSP